jgi:hypothetical protein
VSFFDRFERSAWRLETRAFYGPDRLEFQRFQQGHPPTARQGEQRQQWLEQVAAATQAGRSIGRVLVVTPPLVPYLRWRVEIGPAHLAAGEDIRIADRTQHPALAHLATDFWLFDHARVWALDYSPDGEFLGGRDVIDPAAVQQYRWQRDLAMACSVPLQEFLLPA